MATKEEFIYYTPVFSNQHGLYISEMAAIFSEQTGWRTLSNKPPVQILSDFAREYERVHKIKQLYYETRNGLRRVYLEYNDILNGLQERLKIDKDGHYATYTTINGKKTFTMYREKVPVV